MWVLHQECCTEGLLREEEWPGDRAGVEAPVRRGAGMEEMDKIIAMEVEKSCLLFAPLRSLSPLVKQEPMTVMGLEVEVSSSMDSSQTHGLGEMERVLVQGEVKTTMMAMLAKV